MSDEFDKQAGQNVPYDQLGRVAQKGNIDITWNSDSLIFARFSLERQDTHIYTNLRNNDFLGNCLQIDLFLNVIYL